VTDIVHCVSVLHMPVLPGHEVARALEDVRSELDTDTSHSAQPRQLAAYINRQRLDGRSVGPDRLSVRDSPSRTNNVLESVHSALRRRIEVANSNLYAFLQTSQSCQQYITTPWK